VNLRYIISTFVNVTMYPPYDNNKLININLKFFKRWFPCKCGGCVQRIRQKEQIEIAFLENIPAS
jgi:hypothetical protein